MKIKVAFIIDAEITLDEAKQHVDALIDDLRVCGIEATAAIVEVPAEYVVEELRP